MEPFIRDPWTIEEDGSPVLSLARRPGQKIRIGEDIVLVVREIRGRQVKIGIEAPPQVRVLREEIYEELCAANKLAANQATELPAALTTLKKDPNKGSGSK